MTPSPTALLSADRVLLDLHADDEEAAIRAVAARFAGSPRRGATPEAFAGEVIERERLSSTALGCGVAFPHARTTLVKRDRRRRRTQRRRGAFRRERRRPCISFLSSARRPNARAQYLALVGTLARLLRGDALRQKLLAAPTADAFVAALRAAA